MKNQRGQSIAEFIVCIAVLAPLLLITASFANLLDLSTTTVEAGRFAAWERTVYKESSNYTEAQISAKVGSNIKELFYDRNYTDFGPSSRTLNPSALPSLIDRSASVGLITPSSSSGLGQLYNGNTGLAKRLEMDVDNSELLSPRVSIPLNKESSFFQMVNRISYVEQTYSAPSASDIPLDDIAGSNRFHLESHSALLASGWSPVSHDDMQQTVSDASFDGSALKAFEGGNAVLNFMGFKEADLPRTDAGLSTSAVNQADILPSSLLAFPE